MVIEKIKLQNGSGLHARPASDLVKEAAKFNSDISIRNISLASEWVDAKSILSILTLGVENNHTIEIKAEGIDESLAVSSLVDLVNHNINQKKD
jgi:phosphocarrier protein